LVIALHNFGLGDNLLCTAILRELHQRKQFGVWMMSDYPELFAGMNVERVVPANDKYKNFIRVWRPNLPSLMYAPLDSPDQDVPPRRHIIAEFCARAGIVGSIALRPYLKLTSAEIAQESWARGRVVIQSSGLGAKYPMLNKEWAVMRFQQVVDALCVDFDFVQLGSQNDPGLQLVKDLRGITSIRQSAAILHNARLYIGNVGFLMHLARAVECPGVIVYGGREAPWQSGYICNVNLYTALPCAPCWRWNKCDFGRKCMTDIKADDVVRNVRELLSKPEAPLPVEYAHIE
jgi:ADP-heptose:LPS heptosyltransferase